MLEVIPLPAGHREAERWDPCLAFEGVTEVSWWVHEESGARRMVMHFQSTPTNPEPPLEAFKAQKSRLCD